MGVVSLGGLLMLASLLTILAAVHSPSDSLEYPDIPSRESVGDLDLKKFGANDEQRLFRYLLYGYDKAVRPVFNASHVVPVYIGLTLTHIFNIDERSQVLALNVWVEQSWMDERIQWKPEEFGNLTKLTLATRYLWTPDIVLYNNARDFSSAGLIQTNLHLTNDGFLQWAPPQKIYSRCHMDVSLFPFDHQFCSLIFRSWIYDLSQLDLRVVERYDGKDPFTRDSFTENGEWQIVANRTFRFEQTTGNARYGTVVFEIHLRRRVLYFLYNIIAPCVMLSILTLVQFVLPCESGEKVTLGLTVLLAYSVFSFNIAESMPETSEVIPLIAIYVGPNWFHNNIQLMTIMGISALSVGFSVFVLNVRHGAETYMEIPNWMELVGFSILGPVFGGRKQKKKRCKFDSILSSAPSNVNQDDTLSKNLIDRVDQEQRTEEMIERWSHLSNIFDRFFFCCVTFLTVSSTGFLLFVAPNMENPTLEGRGWSL